MTRSVQLATAIVALMMVGAAGSHLRVRAQSVDVTKLPLLQAADVKYVGSFDVDKSDGSGDDKGSLTYGGWALGVNSSAQTLLIGGHAWYSRLCEIAIPEDFSRGARVVQPCVDVTDGHLNDINKDDPNGKVLGGTLVYKNRLIVAAYAYYDGEGSQEKSHFTSGLTLSQTDDAKGPFRVGSAPAGFVSGYMGTVPPEWQSAIGGPAVTGNCCLAIISRTSSGPALSSFDPDNLGKGSSVPAKQLVGYPLDNELADGHSKNMLFNLSANIKGVAFPSGTRSVLFIGRIGEGLYCYGGGDECHDPADATKGGHAYPYRHQVWAYDASQLADVAHGRRDASDVKPYATWLLREMNDDGRASIAGAAYDDTTRRLYITEQYGEEPHVHVYEITRGASTQQP